MVQHERSFSPKTIRHLLKHSGTKKTGQTRGLDELRQSKCWLELKERLSLSPLLRNRKGPYFPWEMNGRSRSGKHPSVSSALSPQKFADQRYLSPRHFRPKLPASQKVHDWFRGIHRVASFPPEPDHASARPQHVRS